MYGQLGTGLSRDFHHWRNQERLDELEQLLESDYLAYIDPAMAENMMRFIRFRKQHYNL